MRCILPIVVLLAACSPAVRVTRLSPEAYEPRPADHPIRLYQSGRPKCDYEEVGLIIARQRNVFTSMEEVAESMRKKARELGADAVVGLIETDQVQGASAPLDNNVVIDRDPVLSGTAIRFKSPDCRS